MFFPKRSLLDVVRRDSKIKANRIWAQALTTSKLWGIVEPLSCKINKGSKLLMFPILQGLEPTQQILKQNLNVKNFSLPVLCAETGEEDKRTDSVLWKISISRWAGI
jgi:hypothetical protein